MTISRRSILKQGLGLSMAAISPSLMSAAAPVDQSGIASAGLKKEDLTTPCLLLDLDALDANIAAMARHNKGAGISLRPHGKSHKCPQIARRQISAGATGLCVATIREAEAMADAGIRGLLITSELVGRPKIIRLMRLMRQAPDTLIVVDDLQNAQDLNDAAAAAKLKLNVLIDIDPGMHRTGIQSGEPVRAFAEKLARMPHMKLRGLQCYSGSTAHVTGFEKRRQHSVQMMTPALETLHSLRKSGLPLEIMTGGSTGTYNIDPQLEGMNELQCGSYVLMDVDYRRIGGKDNAEVFDDFAPALTVLATVISRNHQDRATIDAGIKAFATDRRFGPEIRDITGATAQISSDEHGIITLQNPGRDLRPGDRIELIVPHCDPNVNLYDRMFCVRGDRVVDAWRIVGRYGD